MAPINSTGVPFKWHRPGLNAYQRWNGPVSPSPVQRDNNRFNQFGGSIGGPIVKNRLFAFFSYETLRNDSIFIANNWYETSQFLQNAGPGNSIAGLLSSYPASPQGTVISLNCAGVGLPSTQCRDTAGGLDLGSPLATPLGTLDPTYAQSGTPYGLGGGFDGVPDAQYIQTIAPNLNTSVQYNGRLDYQATTKDSFSFSSYFVPVDTQSYNGPQRAANRWTHRSLAQSWTGIYTRAVSATMP